MYAVGSPCKKYNGSERIVKIWLSRNWLFITYGTAHYLWVGEIREFQGVPITLGTTNLKKNVKPTFPHNSRKNKTKELRKLILSRKSKPHYLLPRP